MIRASFVVAAVLLASSADAQVGLWRAQAERGDVAAAYKLGVAYRDGDGVLQDYVEADIWMGLAGLLAGPNDPPKYVEEARELEKKLVGSA